MSSAEIRIKAKYQLLGKGKTYLLLWFLSALAIWLPALLVFAAIKSVRQYGFTNRSVICILVCAVLFLLLFLFGAFFRHEREKSALFHANGIKSGCVKAFSDFGLRNICRAACNLLLHFAAKMSVFILFMLMPTVLLIINVSLMRKGIDLDVAYVLLFGNAAIFLLSCVFFFISVQRWFLAPYYFAVGCKAFEAMKNSTRIPDRCCLKIAAFKLTFVPWLIPCALIVPIPFVWSYYRQSLAVLANEISLRLSAEPPAY